MRESTRGAIKDAAIIVAIGIGCLILGFAQGRIYERNRPVVQPEQQSSIIYHMTRNFLRYDPPQWFPWRFHG